jgi:hypothetical protein
MKEEKEKLIPPVHKVFDKCPQCGSTERDVEMEFNYRRAMGIMHQDSFPNNSIAHQVSLQDTRHPSTPNLLTPGMIKVPVMTVSFDSCAKCGTMYRRKFQVEDQLVPDIQQIIAQQQRQGWRPNI